MSIENPQKLLVETKQEIAQFKLTYPGPRRSPFPQHIMEKIKILSGLFPGRDLVKNLSVSQSTIYKAKKIKQKTKKHTSEPFRFVEVRQTPAAQWSTGLQGSGKIIMELKTQSGMVISIFE